MRKKTALATCTFVVLLPSVARADDDLPKWFVSPGVVWSWGHYPGGASGAGFEASAGYSRLSGGDSVLQLFHAGAVFRRQSYSGDAGDFLRYTFAAEVGLPFVGVELGYATRGGAGSYAAASGPHVAPYVSIGVLYAGPQFMITGERVEFAFNLGLKLPLPHSILIPIGIANGSLTGSGRPLRVRGEARIAATARGRAWREEHAHDRIDLAPAAKRAIAAYWIGEARLEHASVAAFAKLSLALLAHAAPPELVARAHEAALDEIRHAKIAFAMAERYGARAVDPGALDVRGADASSPSLEELAVESFVDGCVGEGIAAAAARVSARRATDAHARRTFATIARDEAKHAALAWSVVAMCRARGGAEVARALSLAARAVSRVGAKKRAERGDSALESHGVLSETQRATIARTATLRAVAKLDALLAAP